MHIKFLGYTGYMHFNPCMSIDITFYLNKIKLVIAINKYNDQFLKLIEQKHQNSIEIDFRSNQII